MDANEKLIGLLARSATFRSYERAYTEATGMPLALRPVENWQLPFHGKRRENAFCALMAGTTRTCAGCLQLQGKLAQDALNQPATRTCGYGLCETAVPVKLGSQTIGFLQTGQVLGHEPTEASFRRAVAYAGKLGADIDHEPARQAYFRTPVASRKKLDSASNLLAIFADHLAMKSNQLAVQAANPEPLIVARAMRFVQDHYAEALTLGRVSRTVHASRFHLCKLFRKSTSVTFTEFVSRTRIERAKNLLLNPHPRVSEVAYEVGFQSVTSFNRVFKRFAGQSPTAYRTGLTAAA